MAFVNIVDKKGNVRRVPYGAFENSFERSGWKLQKLQDVNVIKKASNKSAKGKPKEEEKTYSEVTGKSTDAKDEWDAADEELEMEKSIDEMDMNELKEFAESKGIDTKEFKTVGALKKALKEVV